jgi:peptidoglycan-N-acetylglucosamine deacetylase
MKDAAHKRDGRPSGSWRSTEELRARRSAWRGRRRLRRAAVLAALAVVVLAVIVAVALRSSSRTHSLSNASRSASTGRRVRAGGRVRTSLFAQELGTNRHILSYTSYISLGAPSKREVALTFDDGPSPYTPPVLSVLERFHVKATFFEIGRNVHEYPGFTARLAKAGMAIGDHTEQHPPMALLDASAQAAELDEAAGAIQAAGAPRPLLFRPPYGSFDSTTLRLLRERDMIMVLWTVDTSDYERPGVKQIIYTALSGARPGAIILFHDGGGDRSETVAALPRIIERLRQRSYRLVTIPELLRDDPPPAGQSPPVNLSGD